MTVSDKTYFNGCDHQWGEEYHTHVGHKTLGSHAANFDCIKCGIVRCVPLGSNEEVFFIPAKFKKYLHPLPKPHECFAGWEGVVTYHAIFE